MNVFILFKMDTFILFQPPELPNHVLLRELHLSENNISSIDCLSSQWLPLLQHLYVDNNRLVFIMLVDSDRVKLDTLILLATRI